MSLTARASRGLAAAAFLVGIVALIAAGAVSAAPPSVGLGTATSFGVLGGQGVTNTGPTVVNGDLGSCPNPAITGFPPGTVNGTIHANDAVACSAQADTTTAYNDAAGRAATTTYPGPTDLGGATLVAGVYKSPTSFGLTGNLTLDGQNDPDSVWIFQAGSTVITAVNSSMTLINGAQACNVFWQVGSSATVEVGSSFVGTVLALTSIAAKTNAQIDGRLLARNGSVTLDSNVIRPASCATPTTTTTGAGGGGGGGATTTSTTAAAGGGGGGGVTTTTSTTAAGASGGAGGGGSGATASSNTTSTTRRDFVVTESTPTNTPTNTPALGRVPQIPRTGVDASRETTIGVVALGIGFVLTTVSRRGRRVTVRH